MPPICLAEDADGNALGTPARNYISIVVEVTPQNRVEFVWQDGCNDTNGGEKVVNCPLPWRPALYFDLIEKKSLEQFNEDTQPVHIDQRTQPIGATEEQKRVVSPGTQPHKKARKVSALLMVMLMLLSGAVALVGILYLPPQVRYAFISDQDLGLAPLKHSVVKSSELYERWKSAHNRGVFSLAQAYHWSQSTGESLSRKDYDEALQAELEGLSIASQAAEKHDEHYVAARMMQAASLDDLAEYCSENWWSDKADTQLAFSSAKQAIEIYNEILGPLHACTIKSKYLLGRFLCCHEHQYQEASCYLAEVVRDADTSFGRSSLYFVSGSNWLSWSLRRCGKDYRETQLPNIVDWTVIRNEDSAVHCLIKDRYEEADAIHHTLLRQLIQQDGPLGPRVVAAARTYACLLNGQGRHDEAKQLQEKLGF